MVMTLKLHNGQLISKYIYYLAYRGTLSFLIFRDDKPIPVSYRYSGVLVAPTSLIEIALHWTSRRGQHHRNLAFPDHYNLLQYNYIEEEGNHRSEKSQPFWWIDGESNYHKQTRYEILRQAIK